MTTIPAIRCLRTCSCRRSTEAANRPWPRGIQLADHGREFHTVPRVVRDAQRARTMLRFFDWALHRGGHEGNIERELQD